MTPAQTDPRYARPLPPNGIEPNPGDPSWAVTFHALNGLRSGWFLVRAFDRTEAMVLAEYQLAPDEVLDAVHWSETWR